VRRHIVLVLPMAISLTTACSTIATRYDTICSEVATFANSVDSQDAHSVLLTTGRDGASGAGPSASSERNCAYASYEPGRRLCGYLETHTSTEALYSSFRRLLVCGGIELHLSEQAALLDRPEVAFSYFRSVGVRPEVNVQLMYRPMTNSSPAMLRIAAIRRPD
jgi:hypothetical protein